MRRQNIRNDDNLEDSGSGKKGKSVDSGWKATELVAIILVIAAAEETWFTVNLFYHVLVFSVSFWSQRRGAHI